MGAKGNPNTYQRRGEGHGRRYPKRPISAAFSSIQGDTKVQSNKTYNGQDSITRVSMIPSSTSMGIKEVAVFVIERARICD